MFINFGTGSCTKRSTTAFLPKEGQSFGSDFVLRKADFCRYFCRRLDADYSSSHSGKNLQPCKDTLRLGLDRAVRLLHSMGRRIKKKGGTMPRFTIMHIYEIFANNQYEATDELMRAREGKYEKVYLKKVLVKDAEELKPIRHKVNVFEDPKKLARWGTIFRRQITGKW
jgi:hypothetical protein